MPSVSFTDRFMREAAKVQTVKKRKELRRATETLAQFPEIGSANIAASIAREYGPNVRKLVVNPFLVVYEYDKEADCVNILGLIHQRMAR